MLPHQTLPPLAHVTVRVSGVVPAVIIEVWKVVRGFGTVSEWMAPVGLERITSTLLPGSIEGQLGALRRVCFGDMGFVEQLDGLDDDRHIVKWRVISHPLNTNPFPGSFLNYKAKIRLRKITITAATFMEIEAEFDTEHTSAEGMRRELTARHEASIRGLLTLLTAKPAQQQAHVQAMLASLPLGAGYQYYTQGSSTSRSGGGSMVNSGGIASVPLASAGVVLPNGQVALVPNVARMSVPTPGNSGGLANSLSGGVVPDLSANLATSRVLASNNLAAQQALAEASVALHAQHLSAQAQLAGGVLPAVPLMPGAGPLPLPGVLPGAMPGVVPGAVPGVLPGSLPASLHGSGGGLVPGAVPGVMPTAMPGAPHPTVLAAQLAALQGGLAMPVLSGAGGFPPPRPAHHQQQQQLHLQRVHRLHPWQCPRPGPQTGPGRPPAGRPGGGAAGAAEAARGGLGRPRQL